MLTELSRPTSTADALSLITPSSSFHFLCSCDLPRVSQTCLSQACWQVANADTHTLREGAFGIMTLSSATYAVRPAWQKHIPPNDLCDKWRQSCNYVCLPFQRFLCGSRWFKYDLQHYILIGLESWLYHITEQCHIQRGWIAKNLLESLIRAHLIRILFLLQNYVCNVCDIKKAPTKRSL